MEYCFGPGDGTATMWLGTPEIDLDGDGVLDAVKLDFDGDGRLDDAIGDLDGDGLADHAALDLDDNGSPESYFADDGSGTWALTVDHPARGGNGPSGGLRWFGLDGVEHTGGPLVDFDGDGQADDQGVDSDGNGLADRVMCAVDGGATGYVDLDGDGHWDVTLSDTDGDGAANKANAL